MSECDDRFQATFDQIGVGVAHVASDGRWLDVNPRMCAMLGYGRDELLSMTWLDITHPDDQAVSREQSRRVLSGETASYQLTKRYLRKDGAVIWGRLTLSRAVDEDGRPRFAIAMIEDVTDLVRTETALGESEERYRLLAHSSPDAIIIHRAGEILYVNPSGARLLGARSPDHLLGRNVLEFVRSDSHDFVRARIRQVQQDQELLTPEELPLITEDGETRLVEISGGPAWFGGAVASQLLVRDITGRKRAEQALREREQQLSEAERMAGLGSWTLDLDTSTLHWSDGLYAIWGEPREAGPPSRERIAAMVDPADRELVYARLDRLRREGGSFSVDYRINRADGQQRWVQGRTRAETDRHGRVTRIAGVILDITAPKEAEARLRNERQRLEAAQRVSGTGDWEWRPGTDTVVWSDELRRIFGVEPGTPITFERYLGLVHPEDRDRLQTTIARSVETGAPYLIDHRIIRPDGRLRHIHGRGEAERGPDGEVVRLFGTAHDTTDRVRAREALRESQAMLRAVLDHSPALIFAKDPDGRYILANASFYRVTGRSEAEVIGKTDRDLFSVEAARQHGANDALVLQSGVAMQFEEGESSPQGGGTFLSVKFPLRNDAGETYAVCGIATDITERRIADQVVREAESRFRALIENSSEIIAILDAEGTIGYESPAVHRLLGYEPAELLGRSVFTFIHPDDAGRAREKLRRVIRRDRPVSIELRLLQKDGTPRDFAVTAVNLLADPAVGGVVVNARDITDLRRKEEELRHAQKMEAVGRLAGGVAHDFNNMITAIRGFSTLLEAEVEGESQGSEYLAEITRAAERSAALTRQLLAFSRKQILKPQVVDLNAAVAGMEMLLRRTIGENVHMVTELAPDLGRVYVDRGQLEQVIMNLAVNARDAMDTGGTLTLTTASVRLDARTAAHTSPQLRPGRYATLAVQDTGTGIPAELLERIFEPFFTTKEPGKGTGLGLSTVYGIVTQSGGHVDAASTPGVGTTFTIFLPETDGVTADGSAARSGDSTVEGDGETILLVEDEPALRALMQTVLERLGYRLLVAPDGAAAMELARAHPEPVDLLLTDVVMPGMTGRQVAEALMPHQEGLKTLYISGYTEDTVITEHDLGDDAAFLPKPFTPRELAARVREVIRR